MFDVWNSVIQTRFYLHDIAIVVAGMKIQIGDVEMSVDGSDVDSLPPDNTTGAPTQNLR